MPRFRRDCLKLYTIVKRPVVKSIKMCQDKLHFIFHWQSEGVGQSVRNYAKKRNLDPNIPSSAASPRQDPAAGLCPSPPLGSYTPHRDGSCRSCCKSFEFRRLSSCHLWQDWLGPPQLIVKTENIQQHKRRQREGKNLLETRGLAFEGGVSIRGCRDQTPLVRAVCAEVVLPLPEDPAGRCSFPGQKWHTWPCPNK